MSVPQLLPFVYKCIECSVVAVAAQNQTVNVNTCTTARASKAICPYRVLHEVIATVNPMTVVHGSACPA
jgi:hypothetical protein